MNTVIGDILPLAIAIAISPVPIIAAILMLLSPKAKGTGLGFLIGWLVGIIVGIVVFTLLASVVPQSDPDDSQPVAGLVAILLGMGLLLLAVRQWRSRPKAGEDAALPKWMSAIDSVTPGRGLVLGFLLAAVNPKNLLMAAGAGVIIGTSGLSGGELTLVLILYVLIAASSVAIPVLAYLFASARMTAPLQSLRVWLVQNNATVMAVLLLVIGVVMIGKGIGKF
jgi:threonine/homoserine/homoserine lactone efflux protein